MVEKLFFKNLGLLLVLSVFSVPLVWSTNPNGESTASPAGLSAIPPDSTESDSTQTDTSRRDLPYPIKDHKFYERDRRYQFDFQDPPNLERIMELDTLNNSYTSRSKIGDLDYRLPASVSFEEYLAEEGKQTQEDYFRQRAKAQNFVRGGGLIPSINLSPKINDFLGGVVDIRPQGSAELIFAGNFNTVRNPTFSAQQQRTGQFDFKQKIQLNVNGSIGDKLNVSMNYDTEATFEFENQTKLDYAGKEDDIIKKIELGNVSLPLNGSLIQGGQSLFGIKTQMQFGKLTVTSIFTQKKGEVTETEVTGGAQINTFDIRCDDYDMNRHFFLAHYFRENYDNWLRNLPVIGSPVIINQVEVWVTNDRGAFNNTRDVIGFTDMGERDRFVGANIVQGSSQFPSNEGSNNLFQAIIDPNVRSSFDASEALIQKGFVEGSEFQLLNFARQLSPSEFTFNPRLGYISLNQALQSDQMICVAFEYSVNGQVFKVGEFSKDVPPDPVQPNVLLLKMLKGQSIRTDLPLWDLMMKNIYSLGSFQIQREDFQLNVFYADDPSGADLNYLPVQNETDLTGIPLISVLNLDNVNAQVEPAPDGVFDFLEGITINSSSGRIIFPVVEPFGTFLESKFINDPTLANRYAFYALYDSTKFAASQEPQFNKFFLRGSYKGSSSSEISLNSINVPEGSVRVTANGTPLVENQDYVVDYTLGRVKIINTGLLNSGAVIKVSAESNSLFNIQQKTLMGSRFDYKFNDNFILGSTFLYLKERPLTPKVNIGEEPLANAIVGFDGSFQTESRFLTKMVDKLPFLETKEISTLTVTGEYARLFPGVQRTIGRNGVSYIDDFEASETPFELDNWTDWILASTPTGQPDLFPNASLSNDLRYGYNRAKLSWYTLDPLFFGRTNNATTPDHLQTDTRQLSNNYVREVLQTEVFPNRQLQQGQPTTLPTFDLSFYPNQKGPYNFNVDELNSDGTLQNPETKWAGIMRRIQTNDFEAANIDYIEIWMMDPFIEADNPNPNNSGQLYINLGNVSEDILRDRRKSFENGLPRDGNLEDVDTTVWGLVPRRPTINFAFDSDPDARQRQDVGYDGLDDDRERTFFQSYIDSVQNKFPGSRAAARAADDPSSDNYHYYRGSDYDDERLSILGRYKDINNPHGNSPTLDQSPENYATAITPRPEDEDINRDFTVNNTEDYFQYRIDISKDRLKVGENFVTDSVTRSVRLKNGDNALVTWYQLKVPIQEYTKKVGQITDFKSIRFVRLFMTGFEDSLTMRFAQFQLVRADWRKYLFSLEEDGAYTPIDPVNDAEFVVSTVNIEENGQRSPIQYKLPPGILRELDVSTPRAIQQNEQSLSLEVCNLEDGDARGVFKNVLLDIRNYQRLRMFLHAEGDDLEAGELTAFIRLGTDLTDNYYEYEIPLLPSTFGVTDERDIWPEFNEVNLRIDDLLKAKQERFNLSLPFNTVYTSVQPDGRTIRVVGLPDLSQIRVILLGVRNPKLSDLNPTDDGLPKCGEVWFNELRVSDFNNRGGWAANGRVVAKLADFGTVAFSTSFESVGFGGIDKKLNERNFDDKFQYDISSNLNLGKFFPEKSGVTIPMYYGYSESIIKPFYNPLNPDITLQTTLETISEEQKPEVERATIDLTTRRSINFTNVRKNRIGGGKPKIYSIENFNLTYAYTEFYRRNQTIEFNNVRTHRAVLGYNYNFNPKNHRPFKRIGKAKILQPIREFNYFLKPQSFSARVELDRRYGVLKNRNNDNQFTIIAPLYDKNFTMKRFYEFRHDLTRSLKIDYTATVDARIDEPIGAIDTEADRDSIRQNLFNFGRTTRFNSQANVNYTIPINKIPIFNWINLTTRYSANYEWLTAPPAAQSLGNTIQNSRNLTYTGQFNMVTLYNKSKFLQNINRPPSQARRKPNDTTEQKPNAQGLGVAIGRLIMTVKNVSFNYTQGEGTVLPGFTPSVTYLGNNWDVGGPGLDFVFGSQSEDFRFRAAQNGWISNDTNITSFYVKTFSQNFSARTTLEPFRDFRIQLNVIRNMTRSESINFRFDQGINDFRDISPAESGTFSMSYNFWRTAFARDNENNVSAVFQQFENNRFTIAKRLQAEDPSRSPGDDPDSGFPLGYGPSSQDVLIPAFLAAYSGRNAQNITLSAFPAIPNPSWRINYNGLSRIEAIQQYASNVSLSHSYTSTYNVGNYFSLLSYSPDSVGRVGTDLLPEFEIRQVTIVERFSPLLGVDITFINNVTARVEVKRDRTINFSPNNFQLTEQRNAEWVIGAGYRTKELPLPFRIRGRRYVLENDVNFRFDFSIRDGVTITRRLDQDVNEPTAGTRLISIKPTIDYMLNEKLNVRFFYDRRVNKPATTNSFPTAITSGGFSIRYTLQ